MLFHVTCDVVPSNTCTPMEWCDSIDSITTQDTHRLLIKREKKWLFFSLWLELWVSYTVKPCPLWQSVTQCSLKGIEYLNLFYFARTHFLCLLTFGIYFTKNQWNTHTKQKTPKTYCKRIFGSLKIIWFDGHVSNSLKHKRLKEQPDHVRPMFLLDLFLVCARCCRARS